MSASDHAALKNALAELASAREAYHRHQDAVWTEVQGVAPEFALRLGELGFGDREAAEWVCQLGNRGSSPADEILAGRSSSVLAWLEQGLQGFIG
jgi:hypothetical protein